MSGVAARRGPAACVGALVVLLAALLPAATWSASDPAGAVALGALTLALVSLVRVGLWCVALLLAVGTAAHRPVDRLVPPTAGRITDPAHHPLRPRAPGTV